MRILALFLLLVSSPVLAQDAPLVGNWKLVAFQGILDNGPPNDIYGARPKGVLILTREGRMAAIITSEARKAGSSNSERAELHKSMIAYSGKYRGRGEGLRYFRRHFVERNLEWHRAKAPLAHRGRQVVYRVRRHSRALTSLAKPWSDGWYGSGTNRPSHHMDNAHLLSPIAPSGGYWPFSAVDARR